MFARKNRVSAAFYDFFRKKTLFLRLYLKAESTNTIKSNHHITCRCRFVHESEESRPERAGLTTETLLCSAEFAIRLWNKWEFVARPMVACYRRDARIPTAERQVMRSRRDARIPTAEKSLVFCSKASFLRHSFLSLCDNGSYKLPFFDAAKFLRPFGSKRTKFERQIRQN